MQVILGRKASGIERYLLMMTVAGLSAFLDEAPTIQTLFAPNKYAIL
jgi:hypothetical protein